MKKIILGVAAALVAATLAGCSNVRHYFDTPDVVAETAVKAAFDQEPFFVEQCYGSSVLQDKDNNKEILWYKVFQAAEAKNLTIHGTDQIIKLRGYWYIGISYNLQLDDGKNIPCYDSFLIEFKKGGYHIVQEKDMPDDLKFQEKLSNAREESTMYGEYKQREQIFEHKHPDFLTELYSRAKEAEINMESAEQKLNDRKIRNVCIAVASVALIQLAAAMVWKQRVKKISVRKDENA